MSFVLSFYLIDAFPLLSSPTRKLLYYGPLEVGTGTHPAGCGQRFWEIAGEGGDGAVLKPAVSLATVLCPPSPSRPPPLDPPFFLLLEEPQLNPATKFSLVFNN